jgi:hypothetical protein
MEKIYKVEQVIYILTGEREGVILTYIDSAHKVGLRHQELMKEQMLY